MSKQVINIWQMVGYNPLMTDWGKFAVKSTKNNTNLTDQSKTTPSKQVMKPDSSENKMTTMERYKIKVTSGITTRLAKRK